MLMSAVSAEDITMDDGTNSTSDYVELDADSGYIDDISEDSVLEDNVIDDEENTSDEDIEQDISPYPLDDHDFKVVVNGASAIAGASFNKNMAIHKSSSFSHYSKSDDAGGAVNERSIDGMFSDSQSSEDMGFEALSGNINAEYFFAKTYSCCSEYFDCLKENSLKNIIEENEIGDVFTSNIHIGFKTINYLTSDLISFMGAGAKYIDSNINLFDVNAVLDIFDKIMNSPSTHNVMTNISPSNNNPTLRNHKYYSDYSDYSLYQDIDSIINFDGLDDEMELFIESDSNISDMLIIQDNMILINQTFDLNTIPDVYINSYDDIKSDLQSSDGDCWRDVYDNSDATVGIQRFKFSQPINCLSSNISEDIQHTFYHMIGCECTNTSFTKQYASYDNLPEVSEFDTITNEEQEDNHDHVLFKKYNVNAPFIVENTSVFALFGVIKITIP